MHFSPSIYNILFYNKFLSLNVEQNVTRVEGRMFLCHSFKKINSLFRTFKINVLTINKCTVHFVLTISGVNGTHLALTFIRVVIVTGQSFAPLTFNTK
jgi:hypothetical protein